MYWIKPTVWEASTYCECHVNQECSDAATEQLAPAMESHDMHDNQKPLDVQCTSTPCPALAYLLEDGD